MGEWVRGRAFGFALDVDFECPGLPTGGDTHGDDGPPVRLDLASWGELDAAWPFDAERQWEGRADGRRVGRFETHPRAGYFLEAEGFGAFLISADGTHVACAPVPDEPWRWQRYLVGQVLPLVAVVLGREVFHASVVAFGPVAVAFAGQAGAGKSLVAATLATRGARFVADDVMVVESVDDRPAAAPGFGVMSVRHTTVDLLGADAVAGLGERLGADDDAVRLVVALEPESLPLAALYFIDRGVAGPAPAHLVERVDTVDPRLLLASSYNQVIRTPERVACQLEVCSRLAGATRAYRLTIPPGVGPTEVAAAVEAEMASMAVRV